MNDLMEDKDIFRIALSAHPIDKLLPGETELLEPEYPVYAGYWYIGRRGDNLFLFSSNLHDRPIEWVKLLGKLDAIYRCELVERRLRG